MIKMQIDKRVEKIRKRIDKDLEGFRAEDIKEALQKIADARNKVKIKVIVGRLIELGIIAEEDNEVRGTIIRTMEGTNEVIRYREGDVEDMVLVTFKEDEIWNKEVKGENRELVDKVSVAYFFPE